MLKTVQILLLLSIISPVALPQHFIGMHSEAVEEIMTEDYPDFNQDKSFVNKSFNYLKFVDNLEQQTWLFFLDDNDYCKSSKLVCDYLLLDDKVAELNNSYKKVGDLSWKYQENKKNFSVTLKKEEWFFSILTKPIDN